MLFEVQQCILMRRVSGRRSQRVFVVCQRALCVSFVRQHAVCVFIVCQQAPCVCQRAVCVFFVCPALCVCHLGVTALSVCPLCVSSHPVCHLGVSALSVCCLCVSALSVCHLCVSVSLFTAMLNYNYTGCWIYFLTFFMDLSPFTWVEVVIVITFLRDGELQGMYAPACRTMLFEVVCRKKMMSIICVCVVFQRI